MAHPWIDLVVGGVSKPRFIVVSENFCSNPRLNSGTTTGFSASSTLLTLSAYKNSYAYSEYVLRAVWSESAYEYIKYVTNFDTDLNSLESVLAAFRIWDASLEDGETKVIKIALTSSSIYFKQKNIEITNKPKRVVLLADYLSNVSGTEINLRIYNGITFSSSGDMRMDDFYLMYSKGDYQMDCPQDTYLTFDKDLIGQHKLQDGKMQEYNKTWRPNYYAYYLSLSKQSEKFRQRIAEASNVFVIPHIDFMWGFFAKWSDSFDRKYTMKRFLGHESEIKLIGNELLKDTIHPIDVEYIPPPVLYDISITSNVDNQTEAFIYISPDDDDGFSDGATPFVRKYESGESITVLAPSTITIEGESKSFLGWYLDGEVLLTTNQTYTFTVTADKSITAKYDLSISPTGDGYGTGYGSGYGDQL